MLIGYARVSTGDQSLDLQIDALLRAGCQDIYRDEAMSGARPDRPGLLKAMGELRQGDTLIVWRLDRLARSMRDLVDIASALHAREIAFRSITEHIDIGSPLGEFILHVLGAVAQFERALIVERTRAGMEAARERGIQFGRRPALDGDMLLEALVLLENGMKVPEIADHIGVGRSTLYRYLADIRPDCEQASSAHESAIVV